MIRFLTLKQILGPTSSNLMTSRSLNLTQIHAVLALLYTCWCNSKLTLNARNKHTRRESQRRVSVTKMLSLVGLRWKANRTLMHWRSWSVWRETSASRWCANSAVHTHTTPTSAATMLILLQLIQVILSQFLGKNL